jgi:hypothetical protein
MARISRGVGWFTGRENWYRDIWSLLLTIFVAMALANNNATVDKVQEGRRTGTGVSCAISNAIVKAGRGVILSSATVRPRKLEVNLMKLGLPRREARAIAARHAADAYAESIAVDVARVAGPSAKGVVRKDGTLDCQALFVATNVTSKSSK